MQRTTRRRARRGRRCDQYRCGNLIAPGDHYLECVISPHHDDLGNVGWWRLIECAECATAYQRGHLLDPPADQPTLASP